MSYVGTNLYVAGLPPGFNDAHLFQLFDRYGRIWSSRVCPSRRLGGFGYAFVKYGDPSHAAAAVRNLNGYDVGGACITVKFADNDRPPPEEGKGKGGKLNPLNIPADNREVFVSGLRANTDEESVREIFKDMGLTTVKVCCEGKPDGQGYALARFRFPEEAQHAIRMTDGMVHRGIKIRTLLSSSAAAAKGQMTTSLTERPTMPSESLFVMGLPPGSTTETITAFFGQFAGVNFVKVLDTNGKKGDTVALVRMNTLDEAAWCVDRLNGHETAPNLQLVVRFSDPPRAKGGKGFEDMPVPGVRLRGFTDSPYGEAAPPMAQRPVRSFTSDAPETQTGFDNWHQPPGLPGFGAPPAAFHGNPQHGGASGPSGPPHGHAPHVPPQPPAHAVPQHGAPPTSQAFRQPPPQAIPPGDGGGCQL